MSIFKLLLLIIFIAVLLELVCFIFSIVIPVVKIVFVIAIIGAICDSLKGDKK